MQLLERQISDNEWLEVEQNICILGSQLSGFPIRNMLGRIHEMIKLGSIHDPFILKAGPEFLHNFEIFLRDLERAQKSYGDMLDAEIDRIQKPAVRVKKANPPEGSVRFDITFDKSLGRFDDPVSPTIL